MHTVRLENIVKRAEVIQMAVRGEISWVQASEILYLSARQVRRIKRSYERKGLEGLKDHRVGKSPPNRITDSVRSEIFKLYRDEYRGFSPSHFLDCLKRDHKIWVGYSWLLNFLKEKKLIDKKLPLGPHRMRRERKPLVGMMLHMDGSDHHWFGEEDPPCTIMLTLDDANTEFYYGEFCAEEDTRTTLQVLRKTVEKKGIFCSLYVDRGSQFFYTPKTGSKVDKRVRTQVQRAMEALSIRMIPSYSPQARGRMERAWKTFQGRLPLELKKRKIHTFAQATRYLNEHFIPEMNKRFKKEASQQGSAFVPVHPGLNLKRIFSQQDQRKVALDNTVSYKRMILQIPNSEYRYSYARCDVTIYEHTDQTIEIGYGPHTLGFYDLEGKLIGSDLIPKREVKHG